MSTLRYRDRPCVPRGVWPRGGRPGPCLRRHRPRRGGGPGRVHRSGPSLADSGVPPSPAGWIITTARRRAIDQLRREGSREDRHAQAMLLQCPTSRAGGEEDAVPDDRLRLIFTCCHPALATGVQVALTLRLLGGLTTAGDRPRVPHARSDDGAAAGPGEGQDPRRRDPLPGAWRTRSPGTSAAPCWRSCI